MQKRDFNKSKVKLTAYGLLISILLIVFLISVNLTASAQEVEKAPTLHPTFALLDNDGENVLDSGNPVSTMKTCGECHDTEFIKQHSFHADVGLRAYSDQGIADTNHSWDTSPGLFGKWNPLTYRYLTPRGDSLVDLTTAEWLKLFGARQVGGGPAVYTRNGGELVNLAPGINSVETSIIEQESGDLVPWDWQKSGVVEMNCFLCHLSNPDNQARVQALEAGEFGWANTATLLDTGLVELENNRWQWNENAFDDEGKFAAGFINIQDPGNENCGLCHGIVHNDLSAPLTLDTAGSIDWRTETTGQIISPQRLSDSGLNLSGKESLSRSWDVHSERVVKCTNCHYALNNPVYYQETAESRPDHLTFDPRRIELSEYLYRPLHQFAKGQSAQSTLAPEFDDTLRRCESCHSIEATHDWLPYKERHTQVLSCESCHIRTIYAPALQQVNWTVLKSDGAPVKTYRGVSGEISNNSLINGYEPVLLPRQNKDGSTQLAPHNLITSWYWVYGEPERPVRLQDLQAAWFEEGDYLPDVLNAFDEDGNGRLEETELLIDSQEKENVIATHLKASGLKNPHIVGDIQPYSINHDVTYDSWATKDCQTCHSEDSRVTRPFLLSDNTPGGVIPAFVSDNQTSFSGELYREDSGQLYYQPGTKSENIYVLGHNAEKLIDQTGSIIFLATILGVVAHGGLRFYAIRRNPPQQPELKEVYMYGVYERLWHWLQTAAILALLFTGLIIHKPDTFGIFSFSYVVQAHNILAFLLVVNAALAIFYHLVSGEIRQYLPKPYGFFNQTIEQIKFYLGGIFKGKEHPFEKTPQRKLNPLQQITYFGILNILLPLQTLTGILMWGVQKWPETAIKLGGLPFLAPFHTLIAWLFATFIVAHVYLTTTGHTPLANIKSMIMGWDEVEVHHESHAPVTGD